MRKVICNIRFNPQSEYEAAISTIATIYSQLKWVTHQPLLIGNGRQKLYKNIETGKGFSIFISEGKVKLSFFKMLKLLKIIRREKVGIIHCHDFHSYALAGLANIILRRKLIFSVYSKEENFQPSGLQALKFRIAFSLIRLFRSSHLLLSTDAVKLKHAAQKIGKLPNMLTYRLGAMPWAEMKKEMHENHIENIFDRLKSENRKTIALVDNISNDIDIEYLFEVIDELLRIRDDVVLLIFGDGEARSRMLAMIRGFGFGDAVQYLGKVKNVFGYYDKFDLFLSARSDRSMHKYTWQALAASIPVIAYKEKELLDTAESGEFVRFIDDQNFHKAATQIHEFLDDPAALKSAGAQGLKIAQEEFPVSRFNNFIGDLYSTLLEKKRKQFPTY